MINTRESKKVLFRLTPAMKTDFSVALAKRGIGAQHILEAIVERVIAFSNEDNLQSGERKFITNLFARAQQLQADAKVCV